MPARSNLLLLHLRTHLTGNRFSASLLRSILHLPSQSRARFSHSRRLLSQIRSAVRAAMASIVNEGLTAVEVGNTEPSQTNRFGTSCERQSALTTDSEGSLPMRHVPNRWAVRCADHTSSPPA